MELGGLLFEADARQLRAELNRERIENEVERYQSSIRTVEELSGQNERMARVHAEQIRALRDKVEQLTSDRDAAMALSDEATEAAATLRQANHYLQVQNDALRQMLERKSGNGWAETGAEPPATYEGMAEWTEENLVGRLILHPRAVRALQDAQFDEAPLVGRCLNLLAGHYRNMRRGIEGAREAFEQEMAALGLRCSGAISRERPGEQGDDYFVRYRAGSRQRRFIGSHVRNNGNTRAPRRCLAIYFFWDSGSSRWSFARCRGIWRLASVEAAHISRPVDDTSAASCDWTSRTTRSMSCYLTGSGRLGILVRSSTACRPPAPARRKSTPPPRCISCPSG